MAHAPCSELSPRDCLPFPAAKAFSSKAFFLPAPHLKAKGVCGETAPGSALPVLFEEWSKLEGYRSQQHSLKARLDMQHSSAQHSLAPAQVSCYADHWFLGVQWSPSQDHYIPPLDPCTVYLSQRYCKLQIALLTYGLLKP